MWGFNVSAHSERDRLGDDGIQHRRRTLVFQENTISSLSTVWSRQHDSPKCCYPSSRLQPRKPNLNLHGLLGFNFVTKFYKLVRSWNMQWCEQDRDRRALYNRPITFLALRRTPIWQLIYRIQLKNLSVFMDIYSHEYVHKFHLERWIESCDTKYVWYV